MKFRVLLEDSDGVYESLSDEADRVALEMETADEDRHAVLIEIKHRHMKEFASKWIKNGAFLEVEFDTEAGTATVVPVK